MAFTNKHNDNDTKYIGLIFLVFVLFLLYKRDVKTNVPSTVNLNNGNNSTAYTGVVFVKHPDLSIDNNLLNKDPVHITNEQLPKLITQSMNYDKRRQLENVYCDDQRMFIGKNRGYMNQSRIY